MDAREPSWGDRRLRYLYVSIGVTTAFVLVAGVGLLANGQPVGWALIAFVPIRVLLGFVRVAQRRQALERERDEGQA